MFVRFFFPAVETPEEAVKHVKNEVSKGAEYIKIFIEDGTCVGFPGLPTLTDEVVKAAIDEAHSHGKLTIVHVTAFDATERAIDAGIDGLGHLFFDRAHTPELIDKIASSGAFVIPTLVTISSALGNSAATLAAAERVKARLNDEWLASLARSMNVYPQGNLDDVYASIRALHAAGVDILAGSDVSEPTPALGGLAHGASLHHELQLLVAAGLTPVEALQAATSVPARRFGLTDRGRIIPGALADLVLVDGNPLDDISNTLSICSVWHRGVQLQK
jgi:imidazolonepropionase-like amidohydrolase